MKLKTGFTLIEFLLVAGITGIIAVVVFANLGQGERNLAVNRSAQQIAAALREAQNMSLGGEAVGAIPTTPEGGFGLLFIQGQNFAILFADFDNSKFYDGGEEQRTIYWDNRVMASALSPLYAGIFLSIIFIPPNPDVHLNDPLFPATGDALITLQYGSSTKSVRVNQLGNISIE